MGGLLLVTISVERLGATARGAAKSVQSHSEEFEVKNSQVAVLCFFILLGAPRCRRRQLALAARPAQFRRRRTAGEWQKNHRRHDAQEQGQCLFHRLPQRRRRGG